MPPLMLSPSERRRIREVRRYYNRSPNDPPIFGGNPAPESAGAVESTPLRSPNGTLTAMMQLIALRLGMSRAMVSVVDNNAQYFLAEATKSLDLSDSSKSGPGDELWMGCGGTVRSQALCAHTIEVVPEANNYACFSVPDLAADPRFFNLPYVAGGPKFRYYAGTPLISKTGMPIGSVFVIDPRPRGPATKLEIDFLGVMAKNVMQYLEMQRESVQLRRNDTMSKGLAALVEGQGTILRKDVADVVSEHHGVNKGQTNGNILTNSDLTNSLITGDSALAAVAEQSLNNIIQPPFSIAGENLLVGSTPSIPKDGLKTVGKPATHSLTLSRAANLLRESLDVDYTVFFDMSVGFSSFADESPKAEKEGSAKIADTLGHHSERGFPSIHVNGDGDSAAAHRSLNHNSGDKRSNEPGVAKVRSFSSPTASSLNGDSLPDGLCFPPSEKDLQSLVQGYPQEKLWCFDDYETSDFLQENEDDSTFSRQLSQLHLSGEMSPSAKKRLRKIVLQSFPGAREVLFAPLLEADTGTPIAGCFAVSLRDTPVFTCENEKPFVRGFLNSVSIEYNRISIAAADRQKGDFISSISHELRSPLHGILGSAELLNETDLDSSQAELCSTIETCGRVLQETLMDVLEYSKINNLRRDSSGQGNARSIIRTRKSPSTPSGQRISDLATRDEVISLPLDLARMCEDSVAIVAAAHMHHNAISDEFYRVVQPPKVQSMQVIQKTRSGGSVTVSVDVAYHDWNYFCSPGSLQRIIMNLVGNSLKYTLTGYIRVSLRLEDSKDKPSDSGKTEKMVVLQVCDTGKGISTEFLKNKLFTAFSQESSLAPGTGLGLHIVDSLVRMHHGIIDVQSQLDRGTSVTVKLPLIKATAGVTTIDSTNPSLRDDVAKVQTLLKKLKKPTFSLHGLHSTSSSSVETSLYGYLTQWFGLKNSFSTGDSVNLAFINENEYREYLPCLEGDQKPSHVIIVRDIANHNHSPPHEHISGIPMEILTVPFGPCKLTKALLACLSPRQTPPKITPMPKQLNGGMSPPASPINDQSPKPGFSSTINDRELPPQQQSNDSPPSTGSQPKILCVDDNPINLRLLRAFFHKLNFTDITCAENGAQAFEAYRRRIEGFDIVFMDLNMPVCDGFEATRLIRSLEKLQQSISTPPLPRSRVVALTGVFSLRDTQAAEVAGIDDFLTKPMKLSALATMMREWGFSSQQVS
ncbi:hypothetical protein ACMFMG_003164 [Clarireedia jacksonii]